MVMRGDERVKKGDESGSESEVKARTKSVI